MPIGPATAAQFRQAQDQPARRLVDIGIIRSTEPVLREDSPYATAEDSFILMEQPSEQPARLVTARPGVVIGGSLPESLIAL